MLVQFYNSVSLRQHFTVGIMQKSSLMSNASRAGAALAHHIMQLRL